MPDKVQENYFTLLGIPKGYDVDEDALVSLYIARLRELHPDITDGYERESSLLNLAYTTLSDPIARGEYMLQISGVNDADQLTADVAHRMFAMREEYSELQSQDEVAEFQAMLSRRCDVLKQELKELSDIKLFARKFSELRFINAFLKQVEVNVFNRD